MQMRAGKKPDGVCLVVGSCCRGFDPSKNTTGIAASRISQCLSVLKGPCLHDLAFHMLLAPHTEVQACLKQGAS